MKSYQVIAFGAPLEAREAPTPEPRGTEVLLKVAAAGVCHSDLHMWDGYFDLGGGRKADMSRECTLPHTMGHETAGEVVAVGPEAEGVAVGERRVAYPWIGCGGCAFCGTGDEHLCLKPRVLGINVAGGYADFVVVPHPRYLLDYAGIPEHAACTLACSGLTALSALKKLAPAGADDPVLIVGAGGVGLAAVRLAKEVLGVEPIVADIEPEKREAALAAGAAEAVDPAAEGAGRSLAKATGGIAGAIDFVGAPASADFALGALRKGGKLVVVGLFGGALTIPLPFFPFRYLTVTGSYVGSLAEMGELIELVREGHAAPIPIETRPLAGAQAALEDLRAGRVVGRIVLAP